MSSWMKRVHKQRNATFQRSPLSMRERERLWRKYNAKRAAELDAIRAIARSEGVRNRV